jgi:type I restriction enzyme S subunit
MIADLKPYAEYKPSNSPWIGDVPKHWETHRLGSLVQPRTERNRPDLPLLSVAREKGVFVRSLTDQDENHNFIPENLTNYKVARMGDLVINKMKAWQGSMGIAPCDGIVSPAYYVFDFRIQDPSFGQRLLRSKPYVAHFGQASDGVRVGQWDLSIAGMRQIPVVVPLPHEQAAIVRYLDWANARLDRAIRAKRKVITLLDEQKRAIISVAVTRGIDPHVPLKRSGVDWMPEIPAGWSVFRIKNVMRAVDHRSASGKEDLLSVRMHHGIVRFSEHFQRPPQARTLVNFKIVEPGQFVVNRMQAGNGLIFCSDLFGLVSPDYSVLDVVADVNKEFLGELMRSRLMRWKFRVESKGLGTGTSGFLRLYDDRLGSVHVALPPRHEQDSIMLELKGKLSGLVDATGRVQREMDLLREYRTRLIADVVTGKLDVREAAAKLPDAAVEPDTALEQEPEELELEEELVEGE